jgi:hypothetical protein
VSRVSIEAMCWQGRQGERPQNLDKVVNLTAQVSEGDTTYVAGKLPERSSVNNPQSYSCVFGFTQTVDILQNPVTSATDLFVDGEPGTELTGGGSRQVGHITEGTNDGGKGMIFIDDRQIKPSPNMQDWLQGKQANEAGELWTHFRKSEQQPKNRDPWLNCVQEGSCGVAGN